MYKVSIEVLNDIKNLLDNIVIYPTNKVDKDDYLEAKRLSKLIKEEYYIGEEE